MMMMMVVVGGGGGDDDPLPIWLKSCAYPLSDEQTR